MDPIVRRSLNLISRHGFRTPNGMEIPAQDYEGFSLEGPSSHARYFIHLQPGAPDSDAIEIGHDDIRTHFVVVNRD